MITNPLVERGRQQGLQEGLQEGRKTREKEIALSMLQKGFSLLVISDITGLQPSEIDALRSDSGDNRQQLRKSKSNN